MCVLCVSVMSSVYCVSVLYVLCVNVRGCVLCVGVRGCVLCVAGSVIGCVLCVSVVCVLFQHWQCDGLCVVCCRSLQHPHILQCLGLCTESIPFLLVMEFCQLGDLKRYLRAQRKSDGMTPDLLTHDLLTLQRMAYEITSGLLHLHENNYIHR
uniref:Protein kinase domain-containing protein n=1 Tax=Lepisosteus oculatus TaxID=7918 RepID=W5LW27_LEPOC